AESLRTLKQQDFARARALIDGDRLINEKRYAIENEALTLIATQQPMAGDLRALAAILKIATETLIKPLIDIPQMADKACDMLHRALEAFIKQDVEAARGIPKEDAV